jgi:hypothetical protein
VLSLSWRYYKCQMKLRATRGQFTLPTVTMSIDVRPAEGLAEGLAGGVPVENLPIGSFAIQYLSLLIIKEVVCPCLSQGIQQRVEFVDMKSQHLTGRFSRDHTQVHDQSWPMTRIAIYFRRLSSRAGGIYASPRGIFCKTSRAISNLADTCASRVTTAITPSEHPGGFAICIPLLSQNA